MGARLGKRDCVNSVLREAKEAALVAAVVGFLSGIEDEPWELWGEICCEGFGSGSP